jgi:spermidine/putrescine transport system ATP-binding protein
MSDRIVVMNSGRIEQVGGSQEIYERPETEFVAGFIGMSNILEGTVEEVTTECAVVRIGNARVSAYADSVKLGDRVRVLIRPEKIRISSEAGPLMLSGRIDAALYLGESTQWKVALEDAQPLMVVEQNREPFPAGHTRIGHRVWVSWEPDSAVILRG